MSSRRELLLCHENDFRLLGDHFSPLNDQNYQQRLAEIHRRFAQKRRVNVVVPHHNSAMIDSVILHLQNAQDYAVCSSNDIEVTITIVDDASSEVLNVSRYQPSGIHYVRHERNLGRAAARNTGLAEVGSHYTMFVDADVIVYPEIILKHFIMHEELRSCGAVGISANLFNFVDADRDLEFDTSFDDCNDWREKTTYLADWVGCESDHAFVGQEFQTLQMTDNWSKWPQSGYLGPWMLPNMVLGGCFMVPTVVALSVGGQDLRFRNYGFTETSLITKLIIYANAYVIPISSHMCVHVETKGAAERHRKDQLFRRAHERFFGEYLTEEPPVSEWSAVERAVRQHIRGH